MNADKKLLDDMLACFKRYNGVEKVILFGSRARGDDSERSDYDIAVFGALSAEEKGELRRFCSESLHTLHKVDLVFVSEATYPKLKENILKEGILLYGKS